MTCVSLIFFFFSSRRRHTRFSRDWSSDVCSSDLPASSFGNGRPRIVGIGGTTRANSSSEQALRAVLTRLERAGAQCDAYCADNKIGRASCRERGWVWEVGGASTKTIHDQDSGGAR